MGQSLLKLKGKENNLSIQVRDDGVGMTEEQVKL